MFKKKIVKIFFIILILIIALYFIITKLFNKQEEITFNPPLPNETINNSNLIENVSYTSNDAKGNEYLINAAKGEIDYSDPNILYLTNVQATIKLKNSEKLTIRSDFGKYNSDNFDTIFSKNVLVKYLDNEIRGEYLDLSINRNSMIISRKVVLKNIQNVLKADVIEMNLKTKDTKIFMYELEKKVSIQNKDLNGNN